MRVLLAEDDPDVGPDVARALTAAGFVVDLRTDGEAAAFEGQVVDYAGAVLDLGLPRRDGLSVLRDWRANGRHFPVIVLSARSDWTEKVEGIEAGADDYLAKPFQMGELIARLRALVRRAAGRSAASIRQGRLTIDPHAMVVTVDGAPVRVSPLEFRFLDHLAHHPQRAISSAEIAEHIYGAPDSVEENAIAAMVVRLRRKLGAEIIVTDRGYGYRIAG
jgi:DNA-binding response OmpR family regulator